MKELYYYGADCAEMREWISALKNPNVAELCDVLLQEAVKQQEAASEYIWAVNEILHMENAKPFVSFWRIQEWFERCFNTVILMHKWGVDNAISEGFGRVEAERLQCLKEEHQRKILAYVKGDKNAFSEGEQIRKNSG